MKQFSELAQTADKLYKKLMGIPIPQSESEVLISNLKKVNAKIIQSESMFNEITDNDLIDYAAYDLLAEKARYTHLLKQAKQQNIHF